MKTLWNPATTGSPPRRWVTVRAAVLGLLALLATSTWSGCSAVESTDSLPRMIRLAIDEPDRFAEEITRDATTDRERAKAVTTWFAESFEWTATDYRQRTVEEILARGGGNCAELARVTTATLERLGLPMREVREINLHVVSEERQRDAEAAVEKYGAQASVFGARHNDHVWIEIQDRVTGEWFPADPSLGVVGEDAWLAARLGFGERFTLDPSSADMIAPFVIVAQGPEGAQLDRTEHYVVEGFDRSYGGGLSKLPSWPRWQALVKALREPALGALRGEVNLLEHSQLIAELAAVYEALRREAATAGVRPRPGADSGPAGEGTSSSSAT